MLVDEDFMEDRHFKEFFFKDCTWCHGGNDTVDTRALAHIDMDPTPSSPDNELCAGGCHGSATELFHTGLHYDNRGLVHPAYSPIATRSDPSQTEVVEEALGNHCSGCHTKACGDCHISRPQYSGGGFVKGHVFYKTPKPTSNCTGCHGSRIEKEMLAKGGEDINGDPITTVADVHWNPNAMTCEACHQGHQDQTYVNHRYDQANSPRCENCHQDQVEDSENDMHAVHAVADSGVPMLQCQVCHSQPYNNCSGCHLKKTDEGTCYFELDKSWFDFKIGRNHLKDALRPYDYVVLRHVPVSRDTFEFYGENLLSNFDALPTWKYATPHNILKEIKVDGDPQPLPQVNGCDACHGHPEWFLTADDVDPDEMEANASVIVESPPE